MNTFIYLIIGLMAGLLSGLVGIGGGIIIIPALIFLCGFSQHLAQGTTLAVLIPPIGILAAWTYYRQGMVNIKAAALICLGVFLGSYFGARIAVHLPEVYIRKMFALILMVSALILFFQE